jgi:2-polyprenyl-3-methyl-5-hydroxy-6-metoxy-1,4-benzoquinol methylase
MTANTPAHQKLSAVDVYLRNRRFAKAIKYIEPGSHVLDVGSSDLALFEAYPSVVSTGVGIDIAPHAAEARDGIELRKGTFPDAVQDGERFDAVVMLAVAEHVQPEELRRWSAALPTILKPGGTLILTVPSPLVDSILHILIRLRLVAGMGAHEHYGFRPAWVPGIFMSQQMELIERRRFQFGLNNLFVFRRR